MNKRAAETGVVEPTAALISYLDDLLQTATAVADDTQVQTKPVESAPAPVHQPQPEAPSPVKSEPVRSAPKKAGPKAVTENRQRVPAARPSVTPPVSVAAPAEPVTEAPAAPVQTPPPVEPEGRPDWSERPFECLIFRVAGLQLAVPLVLLGAIHRIDDRIKPIPGRPPWYMGMLLDRDQNLKVVDSAEWIMAGRVPPGAAEGYRFVIRLDNSDWALACDEVAQSFTLKPEEVRWRSARSKRPWLAGTVIQHMCALIDVGAMARLLARAEQEQRLDLD